LIPLLYVCLFSSCVTVTGDQVHASILDNLPQTTAFDKVLKVTTGLLLSVSMLFTIPLFFFSVFRTMEHNSGGRRSGNNGDNNSGDSEHRRLGSVANRNLEETLLPARGALVYGSGLLSPDRPFVKTPAPLLNSTSVATGMSTTSSLLLTSSSSVFPSTWCRTSIIRVCTVAGTVVVAILLGPLFSEVISLVGAFSMSLVAFILPAAFYLKIFKDKLSGTQRIVVWVVFVFGIATLCVATWQSVESMVYYFSHDGHEKLCGTSALSNHTVDESIVGVR
jgi:amino acid permease